MITFGSVCSGIEAASVAWKHLGWECLWFSQYDPENNYRVGPDFPSSVLGHHYPHVPNCGDMTLYPDLIREGVLPAPDVLVGGPPCQAFSKAGLRKGLLDERGLLTLKYVELADAIDDVRAERGLPPCVIVYENVPGILTDKTNAFGCLLAGLAGEDDPLEPPGRTQRERRWTFAGGVLGPRRAVAWRCLDAQYFGVAQQRRRAFVVASAGTIDPSQVLFEWEGVRRDTAPSREARKDVAGGDAAGLGVDSGSGSMISAINGGDVAGTLDANYHKGPGSANFGEREVVAMSNDPATSICTNEQRTYTNEGSVFQLRNVMATASTVRRLTPRECERLQGFPDDYTKVPHRGHPAEACSDGPRYRALGNSMAVPVMRWIGERIHDQLGELS